MAKFSPTFRPSRLSLSKASIIPSTKVSLTAQSESRLTSMSPLADLIPRFLEYDWLCLPDESSFKSSLFTNCLTIFTVLSLDSSSITITSKSFFVCLVRLSRRVPTYSSSLYTGIMTETDMQTCSLFYLFKGSYLIESNILNL